MKLKMNLQLFGKDRVLGSKATVAFYGPSGPVNFMEIDSFKPTRKSSQKQFQPLGQVGKRTQDVYEGWEFDCSGGIVDPSYDDIISQLDQGALVGQANMRFRVTETTEYYDGQVRTWVYPDAVLFGFAKDATNAADEIKWSFKGDAQTRIPG